MRAVSVAYSITRSYSFSSAAVMRSRVRGKSRMRAPSAWETALPIAAAVGPAVTSPTPSGTSSFVLINSISISGTSLNFIHRISLPIIRDDAIVKSDLLFEDPARRLDDASFKLVGHPVWIDDQAGV